MLGKEGISHKLKGTGMKGLSDWEGGGQPHVWIEERGKAELLFGEASYMMAGGNCCYLRVRCRNMRVQTQLRKVTFFL